MNYLTQTAQQIVTPSRATEEFLEDIVSALQIADSFYEEAEGRYRSVGDWLCRSQSGLANVGPKVYAQGSFALGTVIKPPSENDDYDIDMICEFQLDPRRCTQAQLKEALMSEMKLYAQKHSMQTPEPYRRCVRLQYSSQAQFHLDATPAIHDASYRLLLESRGISNQWANSAIMITDEEHHAFHEATADWPRSNPAGYLQWFRSRMQSVFEQRRRALALQKRTANVADIPDYQVRTPLQHAIQILKRHRDMAFSSDAEEKPISIIITTLAAHAYQGESTIAAALYNILERMESFIQRKGTAAYIPNPVDPLENFADKWTEDSAREKAFFQWLADVKEHFFALSQLNDRKLMAESMASAMGPKLVEKAVNLRSKPSGLWKLLRPSHKKNPPWQKVAAGTVLVKSAKYLRDGFRWKDFESGGVSLPKGCDLLFEAQTNVPEPYEVFWQIVNTGAEAEKAKGLRGGFEKSKIEVGKLRKKEATRYRGSHSIECFIVKNGLCVAQSEPYIVNIK